MLRPTRLHSLKGSEPIHLSNINRDYVFLKDKGKGRIFPTFAVRKKLIFMLPNITLFAQAIVTLPMGRTVSFSNLPYAID